MILVTGASGFVGKRVLELLLASGEEVVCLVRYPHKFSTYTNKNLHLLKGDLENAEVLNLSSKHEILQKVDRVLHLAALYDLHASAGASYMANVVATMNLLALTRKMPKFKRFIHISTIAIAGDYQGTVPVDEVEFEQHFPNAYAKTKAQAEALLRRGLKKDQLCILRPGIVIGDSKTGVFDKVDGPYMAIEFFKKLLGKTPILKHLPLIPMPMNANAQLPIIPVDVLAQIIGDVVLKSTLTGCHHLITADSPSMEEFAREMLAQLGFTGKLQVVSGADHLSKILKRLPDIPNFPAPLLDYMSAAAFYDVTNEVQQFSLLKDVSWTGFRDVFFRQAMQTL